MHQAVISERIRAAMNELTGSERKAARVLLGAYPIAGLETLARFAERAEVSAPTVLRFVTKLGFEGYPDFQRALREEVQERMSSPLTLYDRLPDPSGDGRALLRSADEVYTGGLRATFARIDAGAFDTAVRLLADRRRSVHTTGGRFSQVLAYYLYAHLHQLRPATSYLPEGPTPRHDRLADLSGGDLLVVFDYRRYQTETIAFARAAADRGTGILLLTDPWLSPIADVAEHVLVSEVSAPSPFDSIVPAIALVEAVVAGLVNVLGPAAQDRIAEVERTRERFGWNDPSGVPDVR